MLKKVNLDLGKDPDSEFSGVTYLILEDDQGVLDLYLSVFDGFEGSHDIQLCYSRNGDTALATVESKVKIDVFISDYNVLGGTNGLQVLEAGKKANPTSRQTMVCSRPDEMVLEGLARLKAAFVQKPIDVPMIRTIIADGLA